MVKKKVLAIVLGTVATIGMAHAAPPTFYAGGDIVQLTTKIDDNFAFIPPDLSGSAKATTLRLKGGMHILDWLDAELHIVLPQDKEFSTAGGFTNKAKSTVFAAFAKPNVNVGPVNLYGLVGFSQVKLELSGGVIGSETETGVAYGVGVQYPFTRNLSGSIDYVQYLKKNDFGGGGLFDVNVKGIGVGVNYTFR
jgi:opacity protein-like surface antigen